jgi:hypothetical protein
VITPQPLDQVPVIVFLAIFVVVNLVAYEIGFRLGGWVKGRGGQAEEGPTGIVVGSVLGLMAFLLAITMGIASDRFDTRRGLVLAETNAIGTAYLRAGYLSDPASADSQALLREYAPLRMATDDLEQLAANVEGSEEIHDELWTIVEDVARTEGSDVVALYVESINEVIDLHTSRFVAGVYARVPPTVLWLLIVGVVLSLGLVGYNAGLSGKRSPTIAAVLVVSLGAVMWLVVDLDRPQDGLLRTSQQPLIDLVEKLESSP